MLNALAAATVTEWVWIALGIIIVLQFVAIVVLAVLRRKNKKPRAANSPGFKQRCKDLWRYFTVYEKIWFFSILVLAVAFAFIFPETDEPSYTVTLDKSVYNVAAQGNFDTLSFEGTTDTYVLCHIDFTEADGTEHSYSLADISKFGEWTVQPGDSKEDVESMTLKLGLYDGKTGGVEPFDFAIDAGTTISIECYYNGDEDEPAPLVVSLLDSASGNKLIDGAEITLEEGPNVQVNSFLVSAGVITFLYVLDVILNIACELLISKQSKWNFIVSLGVEIVEIIICIVCIYRFATMAVTLLFWIPCDIISFVVWHRHPDRQQEELTVVKKLTWWQDVLLVAAIAVWTVGVGYLLTLIEVEGGIFATNLTVERIVCYLDAAASAVGIANGLLILFRYREQWIAWYIVAILETVIDILAHQWVLLILKAGYLTNTTYGYIKWTQYIRRHKEDSDPSKKQTIAQKA